jgi:hypothetical protein
MTTFCIAFYESYLSTINIHLLADTSYSVIHNSSKELMNILKRLPSVCDILQFYTQSKMAEIFPPSSATSVASD